MLVFGILTLCSLVVVEVFLGVACVSAEVVSGEIADFYVFTVG